jgi:hypothetical protein
MFLVLEMFRRCIYLSLSPLIHPSFLFLVTVIVALTADKYHSTAPREMCL